ncbi:hypothetical protein ACS0TY_025178 [Phlomoides rotata]
MVSTLQTNIKLHKLRNLQGTQGSHLGDDEGKFKEGSKSTFTHTKPFTKRVDNMRMSACYQPPKFQKKNDGKENPKQHMTYFVKTQNTAGSLEPTETICKINLPTL